MKVVTLLTDFGNSHYVGEMKGVILSYMSDVNLVDISHEVERHNVLHGAFILLRSFRYFPKGTVHVAVVDPGVGGKRRAIIVETKNYTFIAPDNGLASLAARSDGIKKAWEIDMDNEIFRAASKTFHGRDVFSRAAGLILQGKEPGNFCKRIDEFEEVDASAKKDGRKVYCHVVDVDRFGNIVTNVKKELVGNVRIIELYGKKINFRETFSAAKQGEVFFFWGSGGTLEIGVNKGRADRMINVRVGERIEFTVVG